MKWIVALVCLALIAGGVYVLFGHPAPASLTTTEFDGFVRSVSVERGSAHIAVDDVEFLSGSEARQKAALDTGCPIEHVENCVPSLDNDFYIRNVSTTTTDYTLARDAAISIMPNPGSPDLSSTTAALFPNLYANTSLRLDKQPFHFVTRGTTIVGAVETYTP